MHQLSMFCAEDFHAKTSQWLENVLDWLEKDQDYSLSSCVSLLHSIPVGLSSRMSLDFCRRSKDKTWERSSESWPTAGIGGPTGCLTLNSSESPSNAVVSTLSEIVEPEPVQPEFYLSQKACQGILNRAQRNAINLPERLRAACMQKILNNHAETIESQMTL